MTWVGAVRREKRPREESDRLGTAVLSGGTVPAEIRDRRIELYRRHEYVHGRISEGNKIDIR